VIDQKTIIEARQALGRQLAAHRQAAGYGQHELAPLVHYSRSSLANVETGRQKATRRFWQDCDKLLDSAGTLTTAYDQIEAMLRERRQEAARLPRHETATQLDTMQPGVPVRVARAAHQSQAFLAQWESRCLSPETGEEFAEDLSRLAVEYVHRPLDAVFAELVMVRDRAWGLFGEQRRTSDTRGLLFMASLACGILAHASMDLGDRRAAAHQARVAFRLAAEAEHNGLLAWVLGTQSLIAYCLELPAKAIEFACHGKAYGGDGTSQVWLSALKARACAAQHNGPAARHALTEAQVVRDQLSAPGELDGMGGILVFPSAKQHYYAASTAALVSEGAVAEAEAQQAISSYQTGPEDSCSYGDLALSRVYLAQARLLPPQDRQDPAAAADALHAVFALPPEHRIAGLHRPLRRVQAQLDREPVRHTAAAKGLRVEIGNFLEGNRAPSSA
jgi:hypothetical protein